MVFFGAFMGADELSLSVSTPSISNIKSITVENVVLDTLYATQNVDSEITKDIPTDWDFDTSLIGTYDSNTSAGNVSWILDTISHLIIKRKLVSSFDWTTIFVKEINTIEDFSLSEIDITPYTGRYVYAAIPVLNGVEGSYTTTELDVSIKKLTLSDITGTWATYFTDGACDVTFTTPGNFLQTMYSKYPTYVSNTLTNYQTISVSGEFYPTEEYCNLDLMFDDYERKKYINEFLMFLTNRLPKVLKNIDGRTWLVMVNDGVSDAMNEYYKTRKITFSCVEIGDVDSTEDLYENGLINIPEEFL